MYSYCADFFVQWLLGSHRMDCSNRIYPRSTYSGKYYTRYEKGKTLLFLLLSDVLGIFCVFALFFIILKKHFFQYVIDGSRVYSIDFYCKVCCVYYNNCWLVCCLVEQSFRWVLFVPRFGCLYLLWLVRIYSYKSIKTINQDF